MNDLWAKLAPNFAPRLLSNLSNSATNADENQMQNAWHLEFRPENMTLSHNEEFPRHPRKEP
jgi:hypothetical protein